MMRTFPSSLKGSSINRTSSGLTKSNTASYASPSVPGRGANENIKNAWTDPDHDQDDDTSEGKTRYRRWCYRRAILRKFCAHFRSRWFFLLFVSFLCLSLINYYNVRNRQSQSWLDLDLLARDGRIQKNATQKGPRTRTRAGVNRISAKHKIHKKKQYEYDGGIEERSKVATTKDRRKIFSDAFPTDNHDEVQSFEELRDHILGHEDDVQDETDTSLLINTTLNKSKSTSAHRHVPDNIPRPRNLNILFMGDSLSRFQYLDLAYFLTHGSWIDPLHDSPSMVTDHDYTSWIHFFNHTNKVLAPHEQCDCYRKTSGSIVGGKGIIENRYFRDEHYNNTITYLQKFGDYPFKSSWNVSDVFHPHGPMSTKLSQLQPLFWIGWVEAITNFVCRMQPKPSIFVFNQGWWTNNDLVNETLQMDILDALRACDIVSVYKTTNKGQKEIGRDIPEYESQLCDRADYCLNMTWTALVPEDHYVDGKHFLPPIYTWMNLNLLSLLSSIDSEMVQM